MYASAPGLNDGVRSLVVSGELSWPSRSVECNEDKKDKENTHEKTLHTKNHPRVFDMECMNIAPRQIFKEHMSHCFHKLLETCANVCFQSVSY